MSSPKSLLVPTLAEHRPALREALVEVAERCFFAFVCDCDPERFVEIAAGPPTIESGAAAVPSAWVVTRVEFSGSLDGNVEVAMGEPLARQLLGAFLGLGPDDAVDVAQLSDACGEFCNQVCGTWLTRASQQRGFDLAPPAVERRPAGWLPLDAPAPGDVLVTVNDLPVRLRLHVDPGGG